ncbi:MAG TPA: DUF5925 domain-containing protein [Candidatus Dormibacteraeota bacterium]|nr:DUF5925 domain-containing protein [Candidatus Dormibacteraeota bacterium]
MNEIPAVYDIANGDVQTAVFIRRGLERALRFHTSDGWSTDLRSLEGFVRLIDGEVLQDSYKDEGEYVVLDLPQSVVMVELNGRTATTPSVFVQIHAGSRQAAGLEMARVKELIPLTDDPASDEISIGFWYRGGRGPRKEVRRLGAPAWSESARNYPTTTRRLLEPLMAHLGAVLSGGRLILWHGIPGTGKTSALRTLARENATDILLEYVLDPDTFFGNDAGYFVSVLFNDDDEVEAGKTRVLVLEDCDELLAADAKRQGGQGLARLLNLVDGLIGQGLRIGVLITTNDPLSGFHPAVSRPGRCGAAIAFEAFDLEEADQWLAREGVDAQGRERTSLAELLAIRDGRSLPPPRAAIGFVTSPRG